MRKPSLMMSALVCAGLLAIIHPPTEAAEAASLESTEATWSDSSDTEKMQSVDKSRRHRGRQVYHSRSYRRHHRPTWHYRYYPSVRYYPPVVYYPTVYVEPAPTVVVSAPQPQPVVQTPAPVVTQAQVAEPPEDEPFGASVTFRLLGLNTSDTQLAVETIRGANLVGAGGAIRFDVDPHWMIELGLDILGAEEEGVEQFTIPITLSALAHLFPESTLDPYGIAGLGIMFTEFDDPEYGMVEQYMQLEGHLGAGLEVNLGSIVIASDVRFVAIQARPERDVYATTGQGLEGDDFVPTVRGDETTDDATGTSPATQGDSDDLTTAIQFMAGVGWRF